MSTERETAEPGLSPADPGSDGPGSPVAEADVTAHLVPHFPGEERGTGVVLYGAARGVLRVQWRLEPDTLEQVVGSFPIAGARPTLVLRLRRLRPDGGSDQLDEVRLAAVARSGSGFREFSVPVDHGRYRADLGLTNGDGGWLMLARSNDLDNVAQVGVDLSRLAAAVPRAAVRTTPLSPIALDLAQSVEKPADQRPTDARPVPIFPLALRLIAEPTGQSPPGPGSIPPTEPASAAPEAAEPVTYGPIAPLSYGQEPVRSMGVQILAELRILGQAVPGTEIDLFGHPYRVGPGGRFQLVVLVDDPELLRRALALHPPPELREVRDD